MLEHHPDVLAHLVDVDILVREVELVDAHGSGGDVFEAVEATQEGRLAGTGRPDDADHFTALDVDVQALEDLVVAERLLQSLDRNLDLGGGLAHVDG